MSSPRPTSLEACWGVIAMLEAEIETWRTRARTAEQTLEKARGHWYVVVGESGYGMSTMGRILGEPEP